MAGKLEVTRLLSLPHGEIEPIFSFSRGECYTEKELRRRFKKIALLVHPDKNLCENAGVAFAILSNALEVLLTRLSEGQRSAVSKFPFPKSKSDSGPHTSAPYDSTRRNDDAKKATKQPSKWEAKKPRKDSNTPGETEKNNIKAAAEKLKSYWATAEQECFDENLKQRIDSEVRKRRKIMKKNEIDLERSAYLEEECSERQKNVESRANSWRQWSQKNPTQKGELKSNSNALDSDSSFHSHCSSRGGSGDGGSNGSKITGDNDCSNANSSSSSSSSSSSTDHIRNSSTCSSIDQINTTLNNTSTDTVKDNNIENSKNLCCFICMRLFTSHLALEKHEKFSNLHRDNLLKDARTFSPPIT